MTLEEQILSEIKPTPEECAEIVAKAERLKVKADQYLKDHQIRAEARFVGSVGKGTFLREPDIDLFLLFDTEVPREEMEKEGLQAGKDLVGGVMMFAEHPYTTGIFEGLEVDMVPCYAVETPNHIRTSVDRTPFHADYIINHTDEKLRDDIRLMKRFMKGIGTYGAEPDVRGFSGYLCELITIKYGGFLWAVRRAAQWKVGTTVFIEEKGEPMKGPLVFYDPVDKNRNVASAVHEDTLSRFISACKDYLENPDRRFFFPNKRTAPPAEELMAEWKQRDTGLLLLTFDRPDIIPENLHAQVWKSQYAVEKKLNSYGFEVLRAEHGEDEKKVSLLFELSSFTLPALFTHDGPPVHVETAEGFLEKWMDNEFGRPFIADGRWRVVSRRPFTDAAEMISAEVHHAGLGKAIDPASMSIYTQEDAVKKADPVMLAQLFNPLMPWEF